MWIIVHARANGTKTEGLQLLKIQGKNVDAHRRVLCKECLILAGSEM
jgi:hypothetical protein